MSLPKFPCEHGLGENTKPQGHIEHGRFHGEHVFLLLRSIKKTLAVKKWVSI